MDLRIDEKSWTILMHFDIEKHTIYLARHGSHAYGTNIETSDEDIRGFAVTPKNYALGFAYSFEQHEQKEPNDCVVYDIRKFFKLAADCNPNALEVLFVDESDILKLTPAGRLVHENRHLFLSKKARHTLSGYAISQLKRIKSHRQWLLNPPSHKPTREEFKLGNVVKMTADNMGAYDKIIQDGNGEIIPPSVMEIVNREKQYLAALNQYNQYENWKKTRNPARAELEVKHGYDSKHAMHLVRLLRMCREILADGKLIVKRPDAEELKEIRAGKLSYDELVEWAERQDAEMQVLYEQSTLRHSPDIEALNNICVLAQEKFWSTP